MIDERQKASKILEELLDYFFRNGVTDLNMSLNFQGDQVRIHVFQDRVKKNRMILTSCMIY